MSQRRSKKELSIMDNVDSLTDQELRAALKKYDVTAGPITDSTRNLYKKKLASIIEKGDANPLQSTISATGTKYAAAVTHAQADEDEDTSDEDFNVREEELEEEDDDDDEEFDDDEEEDLMSELQDDGNSTYSRHNTTGLADLTTRDPAVSARRFPFLLVSPITFFLIVLSFYLLSSSNFKFLEPLKPFKNIMKQIFILAALSTVGYTIYKTFSYYRRRRSEENKRVCNMVVEALELLQSPDNPKGLMPILHIRDTLLTPAERKSKKMIMLWTKAVKFIEEHESRVKVELANIDGEDFRAWKWIGSKKL